MHPAAREAAAAPPPIAGGGPTADAEHRGVRAGPRGVTARAVVLGLLGTAVLCAVTPYNNYKVAATLLGGNQFPIFALFVLILLVGLNIPLRRLRRARAFAPGEMLTIWTMIVVASGIPSSGMMRTFIPGIAAPLYFSNSQNDWERKVWGGMPEWLKMHDAEAAKAFFTGYPRGQERIPWGAWAGPLFFWGLFAVFFLVASFSVANLLRRQWVENEKFAFPLVTLPVLLAEEPEGGRPVNGLLRRPLLWLAVALTSALHTLRGTHLLYPTVPDVPLQWNLNDYLTVPPWSQIGLFPAMVFFLVIGLSYLLSAEVAFSLWFFFLFYKLEILVCAIYNWDMRAPLGWYSQKLFHALQAFGGATGLLVWTLWTARGHLRAVWRKAMGGPQSSRIDDSAEMLSYRATVTGLILSYGGMGLWLYLAGVPLILIALSLFLTTLALVVISWLVCQAGMLFMAMPYGNIDLVSSTVGTASFKIPPLYTLYNAEGSFIYNTREMVIPSLLNGAKTADAARFPVRPLLWATVASVGTGLVVSAWASLWLPYHNGGGNAMANSWTYSTGPQLPLRIFGAAASVPYVGSWTNALHILGGFVGVFGLLAARSLWNVGLHPVGFLGASTHAVHSLWFSFFLGWLCKRLILRYGGMKGYATALPFFLGLVVGDVLNAVAWVVLGYLTNTGYNIMPT